MHKRLLLLLAGVLAAVMAYGLVGVGAVFTDRWTATQEIHIGRMTLRVSSDTPGAQIDPGSQTVTFRNVSIGTSSTPMHDGVPVIEYDHFLIQSVGSIPARMSVKVTVETSGGVEAGRFMLVNDTPSGPHAIHALPVSDLVLFDPQAADIDGTVGLRWSDLTNDSMGGTITLRLVIDAVE